MQKPGWTWKTPYGAAAKDLEPAKFILIKKKQRWCVVTTVNACRPTPSHCLRGCGDYKGRAPAGALNRGTGHVLAGSTKPGVNGLHDMGVMSGNGLLPKEMVVSLPVAPLGGMGGKGSRGIRRGV
ncbi:hypothetical protein [Polynucleobacter necessarius]|uniref:hypothetical protein n=1 Tax=Polynucleobacter necessarius TaxID=576610 RepID=UPI000E08E0B2|nr:hypothetical protein [Polynucleobacter necessarius]HAT38712.1 hypothetical protein [Polynucleobacter sp.]